MVQEFLVQAEGEVEEEMAEDLSAGELQEKLKRLESLQQLQLCNEDKVTTIERSAESEEVRKALQKNPDISKERSNLLQGGGTHHTHTHTHHHSCTNSTMHSSLSSSTILPPPTPHTHISHTLTYTHSSLLTPSHTLTGWSHVSFTLKDRLGRMRRRAEMVRDLEEALHTSSEGLQAYQGFLEQPLPPSVLLAARQQELHNTGVKKTYNLNDSSLRQSTCV